MNSVQPAIVAIGYNRPAALSRLLESIGRADFTGKTDVTLIISLDRSDNQADVAAVAEAFKWPYGQKKLRCFEERQGLRNHVLQCGDEAKLYGAVILLEDDLLVSPGFYQYACQALSYYGDHPELAGVSLYSHAWNGYANVQFLPQRNGFDTYLGQFSVTWGQCWTAGQWQKFREWYHDNPTLPKYLTQRVPADLANWPDTSWGKYYAYYMVENDLYYVMPYVALSTNCEEAGQHAAGGNDAHQVMLLDGTQLAWRFAPTEASIRYDLFFERVGMDFPTVSGICAGDVCVDLNDTKRSAFSKRYLLSTAQYELPVLASFGLRLRPIEANVYYGIAGTDIRLYDTGNRPVPAPASSNAQRRMEYETYDLGWRRLLRYSIFDMLHRIGGRIRRLFSGGRG